MLAQRVFNARANRYWPDANITINLLSLSVICIKKGQNSEVSLSPSRISLVKLELNTEIAKLLAFFVIEFV